MEVRLLTVSSWSPDKIVERAVGLGRWTFAFMGVPLNLPGGLGSPADAVAVL